MKTKTKAIKRGRGTIAVTLPVKKQPKTVPSLRDLVVQLQRFCYRYQVRLDAYDSAGDGRLRLRSIGSTDSIIFTLREEEDETLDWDAKARFFASVLTVENLPLVGPVKRKKPVLKKLGGPLPRVLDR